MITLKVVLILAVVSLCLYGITYLVSLMTGYTSSHRNLWNIIIFFIALITAVLGIIMLFLDAFDTSIAWQIILTKLHVRMGLILFIIFLIHIFWHYHYFKKITSHLFEKEIVNGADEE